jgi:hypothetical protein
MSVTKVLDSSSLQICHDHINLHYAVANRRMPGFCGQRATHQSNHSGQVFIYLVLP